MSLFLWLNCKYTTRTTNDAMGITFYNNQNAAKRSKHLKIRIFNNNLEVINYSQNGAFRS